VRPDRVKERKKRRRTSDPGENKREAGLLILHPIRLLSRETFQFSRRLRAKELDPDYHLQPRILSSYLITLPIPSYPTSQSVSATPHSPPSRCCYCYRRRLHLPSSRRRRHPRWAHLLLFPSAVLYSRPGRRTSASIILFYTPLTLTRIFLSPTRLSPTRFSPPNHTTLHHNNIAFRDLFASRPTTQTAPGASPPTHHQHV
jgi:hypothetical protein